MTQIKRMESGSICYCVVVVAQTQSEVTHHCDDTAGIEQFIVVGTAAVPLAHSYV